MVLHRYDFRFLMQRQVHPTSLRVFNAERDFFRVRGGNLKMKTECVNYFLGILHFILYIRCTQCQKIIYF